VVEVAAQADVDGDVAQLVARAVPDDADEADLGLAVGVLGDRVGQVDQLPR
jgi:hypothetical protein